MLHMTTGKYSGSLNILQAGIARTKLEVSERDDQGYILVKQGSRGSFDKRY